MDCAERFLDTKFEPKGQDFNDDPVNEQEEIAVQVEDLDLTEETEEVT